MCRKNYNYLVTGLNLQTEGLSAKVLILVLFFMCSCTHEKNQSSNSVFELMNLKKSGIDFKNDLHYSEEFNVYLYKSFYNGAGVGLGDLNNDGLQDIFFCGNQVDNKCYLNKGNFEFEDITAKAGLASPGVWSTGVSIVDVNGDGWLDIYVCKAGKPEGDNRHNELFINQGNSGEQGGVPTFREAAAEYGIDDIGLSTHAAFFDMDKDGDLDMYLLNNSIHPSEVVLDSRTGLRNQRDPHGGNKLYRNDGDRFMDISEQTGIYGSAIGFGLGVSIGDINRDGWPDIYVSNDFFEKDYLYLNNKNGDFEEVLEEMMSEISQGAMGVDMADMNNDGYPEVFVTEMLPKGDARLKTKVVFDTWDTYQLKEERGYHRQFPRNSFQLNNGKSGLEDKVSFSEISRMSGVNATDWSWGVLMADFNNSGHKEIFVTNGIYKDLTDLDYLNFYSNSEEIRQSFREKGTVIKDLIDLMPSVPLVNPMYSHQGNLKYDDMSQEWGLGQEGFSTGSAYGDLDNDGDLDLIVNNINMPPFLYRNNSAADDQNHFLNISLGTSTKNRFAVGSQVTLWANGEQFFQELLPMRGSMSTVDHRLHFGLGESNTIDSLVINWPDGNIQKLFNLKANQFLVIDQPDVPLKNQGEEVALEGSNKLVHDITSQVGLAYKHKENNFVDFDRDKLLYHMISNEGPGLATGDVNNDGLQDFYIGGSKDEPGKLFLNSGNGTFKSINEALFELDRASEDTDAVFGDIDSDGDQDLIVASGGYEFSSASFALANRVYFNNGKGDFSKSTNAIPFKLGSTSCVAIADYDKDGDKDIFFGGRVEPLTYGIPTDSYLLRNDGKGNFEDVTLKSAPGLNDLGMVTDACWVDFDNDGDEDLVMCGDWMPITVFRNDDLTFADITQEVGLDKTNGFWNVLEKADFDNDGNMDLVAGNLGLNTEFKASFEKPVSMYVNDFDKNGKLDQVITVFENDRAYTIATKSEITSQMPYLLKKYLKYHDFKEKTIEDIFSQDQISNSLKLNVYETQSMVFMNKEGYFKPSKLPAKAQLAPTYGILAKDVDNDGKKDILLGGNQYRAKPKVGIYAGSYGTVVKILGENELKVLDPNTTGFFVEGEIRNISSLSSGEEQFILVARSNDSPKVFKINK